MIRLMVAAFSLMLVSAGGAVATEPAAAAPTSVLVTGHVRMRSGAGTLQRADGRRWHNLTRVRVLDHQFSARTRQRTQVARYRLRTKHGHSRPFVVRLAASGDRAKAAPASDACGTRPAKADGTLWSCTFDDEFSGTTLDPTHWVPQTDFATGTTAAHACYTASPNNIDVADGALNLTIRKEPLPIDCANTSMGAQSQYSAGSVMSYHLFSQQYGRFEARVKTTATTAPGLQETFWLWPDDRVASTALWPAAGEIDVAETYSQYPGLAIPFLHYTANDNGGAIPGLNTAWTCQAQRGVYNTYTLTWTAQRLEIDINGQPCLVNTSGDPAFQKPYIMALTALLGTGANALTSSTPLPATTSVDYVRVWK